MRKMGKIVKTPGSHTVKTPGSCYVFCDIYFFEKVFLSHFRGFLRFLYGRFYDFEKPPEVIP